MSYLNIHLKWFSEATSDSTVVTLFRGFNLKTATKKRGVWEDIMYFALHTHPHTEYIHTLDNVVNIVNVL